MPQSVRPPPGWYRDSTSTVPLLRYWDGASWTAQTRLPDVPAPRRRWWQVVKWGAVAAFVLAVAVIAVAIRSGQPICSVTAHGEVTFAAKGERCVPEAELEKAQDDLSAEVAATKADAAAAPVPSSLPDLNGRWSGSTGITYVITQGGSGATIEEYTPGLGLTATGVGRVTGQGAHFGFTAYNGSTGQADYTLQGQDVLAGTVTNATLGTVVPAVLQRSG